MNFLLNAAKIAQEVQGKRNREARGRGVWLVSWTVMSRMEVDFICQPVCRLGKEFAGREGVDFLGCFCRIRVIELIL